MMFLCFWFCFPQPSMLSCCRLKLGNVDLWLWVISLVRAATVARILPFPPLVCDREIPLIVSVRESQFTKDADKKETWPWLWFRLIFCFHFTSPNFPCSCDVCLQVAIVEAACQPPLNFKRRKMLSNDRLHIPFIRLYRHASLFLSFALFHHCFFGPASFFCLLFSELLCVQVWSKVTSLTFDVTWMTPELLQTFTESFTSSLTFVALHDWRKWDLPKTGGVWAAFIKKVFSKLTGLNLVVTTAFKDSFKHAFARSNETSWPHALTSFELQGDAMGAKFPFPLSMLRTLTSFSTNMPVASHLEQVALKRELLLTKLRLEGGISDEALKVSPSFLFWMFDSDSLRLLPSALPHCSHVLTCTVDLFCLVSGSN